MANFPTIDFVAEPTRNAQFLVSTATVNVSEARTHLNKRKHILIRNISTDTTAVITLNPGFQSAIANTGIVLNNQESVEETSVRGDGEDIFQGMWTAICNNANGILAIFER